MQIRISGYQSVSILAYEIWSLSRNHSDNIEAYLIAYNGNGSREILSEATESPFWIERRAIPNRIKSIYFSPMDSDNDFYYLCKWIKRYIKRYKILTNGL
jgi:hypothetical protein